MSDRGTIRAAGVVSALAFVLAACRAPAAQPPPPSATRAASAETGTVPHGDHNPHHGGIVMMKGDLHYEVVVDRSGRSHQVFFTDAIREELPASIASSAALTIHRPDGSDEAIPLRIDDSGESWIGSGRAVGEEMPVTARLSFTIRNEPYSIEIPIAGRRD